MLLDTPCSTVQVLKVRELFSACQHLQLRSGISDVLYSCSVCSCLRQGTHQQPGLFSLPGWSLWKKTHISKQWGT